MPYLYATTALGVHATPARRVLVPCAHDEPPLRLAVYDDAVAHADAFSANTPEEAALLGRRFGIGRRVGVMGVGVEPPAPADPERFRAAFGISGDYVVCVSRVDPAKGVHLLARRFGLMRRRLGDVTLVLIGPVHEPVPPTPGVVVCGFVDEAVERDAIAGARALILPSAYESLSIATLEAWLHGRPTVVNAGSDVLVGQTRRSGGGLWFRDAATLEAALLRLLRDPALGDRLGASGRAWTREHGRLGARPRGLARAARPPRLTRRRARRPGTLHGMSEPTLVEVFLDVSCPWCHGGLSTARRVLDEVAADPALPRTAHRLRFIRLHPFGDPAGYTRAQLIAGWQSTPEEVAEHLAELAAFAASVGVRIDDDAYGYVWTRSRRTGCSRSCAMTRARTCRTRGASRAPSGAPATCTACARTCTPTCAVPSRSPGSSCPSGSGRARPSARRASRGDPRRPRARARGRPRRRAAPRRERPHRPGLAADRRGARRPARRAPRRRWWLTARSSSATACARSSGTCAPGAGARGRRGVARVRRRPAGVRRRDRRLRPVAARAGVPRAAGDPRRRRRAALAEIVRVAGEVFAVPPERIATKERRRQSGEDRYGRMDDRGERLVVTEGGLRFEVNLFHYLDTGLFLDHRPTRARLRELAQGRDVLNLFCYTASATVYAAAGGARTTTSVNLSSTYLEWAARDLALNGLDGLAHELVAADVAGFLRDDRARYDLVFVDPPTFSNSKRAADFDVQRHHVDLLRSCAARLAPDGLIVFSTNYRRFVLDEAALPELAVRDVTRQSIPPTRAERAHPPLLRAAPALRAGGAELIR